MRGINIDLIKHDPYLYIDNDGNLQLLVPLTTGDSISLDNTCKTGTNTAQFFQPNGALNSLQQFEFYCLLKHKQMGSFFGDALKYQKWLLQINSYKKLLKRLNNETMVTQTGLYPEYPPGVINALDEKCQNAKAILLSPATKHNYLRFHHYQCSFNRTISDTFSCKLKSALSAIDYSQSPQAQLATITKIKNTVMDNITQQLPLNQDNSITTLFDYVDFMINMLIMSIQHHTEEIIPLKRTTQDTRTALAWDDQTEVTISEAVNCLLSSLDIEYIFWMRHSNPFQHLIARLAEKELSKSEHKKCTEQLSIVIQFYIGLVNIYCYEHSIINATTNFGELIESNRLLCDDLISTIKTSIIHSDNTENAIIDFINKHKHEFKLSHHISKKDIVAISERFVRDYISISQSLHFDEFLFFTPQHKGNFITYRGVICMTLSDFTYYQSRKIYREVYEIEKSLPNYLSLAPDQQEQQLKPQRIEPLKLLYDYFEYAVYLIQTQFYNSNEMLGYFLSRIDHNDYQVYIPYTLGVIDLIVRSSEQLFSLLSVLSAQQRQQLIPLISVILQKHLTTAHTISQFNNNFPTHINTLLQLLKNQFEFIVKQLNDLHILLMVLDIEQISFLLEHIDIHKLINNVHILATMLDTLGNTKQALVLKAIGDLNPYIKNQVDFDALQKYLPKTDYHQLSRHLSLFEKPNILKRKSHQTEFNDYVPDYRKRSRNSGMM